MRSSTRTARISAWAKLPTTSPSCAVAEGREARSPGGICRYIRRRSAPALGRGEKRRILFPVPRTAIAGNRDGGGVCGMAAPQDSGGLGISGSTGNDHGAEVYFARSRKAVQFRVSSVPRPGRPGGTLEIIETGRNSRATKGRIHTIEQASGRNNHRLDVAKTATNRTLQITWNA